MELLPHQITAVSRVETILKQHNLAILSGEVRSGKTLVFCKVLESYKNALIITQKDAISGIVPYTTHTVTNFHSMLKWDATKRYDIIVIDESHRYITSYPKKSRIWKSIREFTKSGIPIIFASGTPSPESFVQLYSMLALSNSSPWSEYKAFTKWFEDYGVPTMIRIAGGLQVKSYAQGKDDKIFNDVKKLIVSFTQIEAGHKHIAKDHIIRIPYTETQELIIDTLKTDQIYNDVVVNTPSSLMQKIHQIGGGTLLDENQRVIYFMSYKLEYLKENIKPNSIVLAYYIKEQEMLRDELQGVTIGSVTKLAEGVDLSMYDNMYLYSFGFSSSKFIQVRARQMNINRETPITVNILCTDFDKLVYDKLKTKKNFTSQYFKGVVRWKF